MPQSSRGRPAWAAFLVLQEILRSTDLFFSSDPMIQFSEAEGTRRLRRDRLRTTRCSRARSALTGAGTCVTKAAQDKRPFYVGYDMPGMSTGVAGNSEGKLLQCSCREPVPEAQLASGHARPSCDREKRRATCFLPGTMGLTPTARPT